QSINFANMKNAIIFGSALASFCVEKFGTERLENLTSEEIKARIQQFVALSKFEISEYAYLKLLFICLPQTPISAIGISWEIYNQRFLLLLPIQLRTYKKLRFFSWTFLPRGFLFSLSRSGSSNGQRFHGIYTLRNTS